MPVATTALTLNALVWAGLGVNMVLPVGGADMPIIVSLLNSFSGIATSAAGFMLGNDLLTITGALVASSGMLLSDIMCKGINRSLGQVLLLSVLATCYISNIILCATTTTIPT